MENLKIIKNFEIPKGTKIITQKMFNEIDNTKIKSITIPDGVTKIDDYAFYHCWSLKYITIPDSVEKIGFAAFDETQISWKAIPKHIYEKQIPEGLFSGMNMEGFEIPNSVEKIGDYAFGYCKNLQSITIPNTVKEIGDGAFEGCNRLDLITIPEKFKYQLDDIGIDTSKVNVEFTKSNEREM